MQALNGFGEGGTTSKKLASDLRPLTSTFISCAPEREVA
jgi:hypothetical protein